MNKFYSFDPVYQGPFGQSSQYSGMWLGILGQLLTCKYKVGIHDHNVSISDSSFSCAYLTSPFSWNSQS